MNAKRLMFCKVIQIEGATVTLLSPCGRKIDLVKDDFHWDVNVGDKVCMNDGFIHSRVPEETIPYGNYIKELINFICK